MCLLHVTPVIDPAQFLQAIIIGFAGQIVERIPQEVNVTTLPNRFRQHFLNSPAQASMIIADHKLHTIQRALLEAGQQFLPTRSTLAAGQFQCQYVAPANAGKPELQDYMATHKRTPKGRLSDGAVGFSRLPALLAPEGLLCKPDAPAPWDKCLHRFQQHLIHVRGTTLTTDAQYRQLVRPFVVGLCSGDGPEWPKLTAEYVTNFVLQQAPMARAQKGRIVSAIRTFLRFLITDGIVPPQMVRAIPRIRRW